MPADIVPTLSYNVCDGLLTGLAGLAVEAPEARSRQVPPAQRDRRAAGAELLGIGLRGGGSRPNGVTAECGQLAGESAGRDRCQVK